MYYKNRIFEMSFKIKEKIVYYRITESESVKLASKNKTKKNWIETFGSEVYIEIAEVKSFRFFVDASWRKIKLSCWVCMVQFKRLI